MKTVTTVPLNFIHFANFLRMLDWSESQIIEALDITGKYGDHEYGSVKVMGRARGTDVSRFVQFKVVSDDL